jgi:hypothetical protein
MTVANTTFTANSSTSGDGGAIDNEGNLDVTDSTIIGNSSTSGDGGGVSNNGSMTLTGCDVSDNQATDSGNGAGLFNFGPLLSQAALLAITSRPEAGTEALFLTTT